MEPDRRQQVDTLVAEHGRVVLAAALRVLGSLEDAEDVLQEVFVRLLEGRGPREEPREWGAFLRVMATHAAIDRLRARPKASAVDPEVLFTFPARCQSPAEAVEQRRLAQLLRQALAELPEREARVFVLRHFEEMNYEEIASAEESNPNQIGVMLSRTRRRLREILEPLLGTSVPRKD